MNTNDLVESFLATLTANCYDTVRRSNLLSPYFKNEFNLSGAHDHLIPAIQNMSKVKKESIGVVDLVVRDADLGIIGESNSHLLLFEMGVFGSFGHICDLQAEIRNQFEVLFKFFELIGVQTKDVIVTICSGGNFLSQKFPYDDLSEKALIEVGFNPNNIVTTEGRRNFMLSQGIDRLAGYNVEFFILKNGEYVEIASSNIYKYLNKLTHLEETINNGVGCGIGFERLSYVLGSNLGTTLSIDPFETIYSEVIKINSIDVISSALIESKIRRAIELIKSILFIVNDGIYTDKTAQGKKLKKYIAKAKSELEYNSVDVHSVIEIAFSILCKYYKRYELKKETFDYVIGKFEMK